LIPFLKEACELSDSQAYLVTFAFYISYFVMALPSSWVLKKTGFAKGMALGLIVMAIGSLVFIPAANERSYVVFLVGLFLQGTGLALLQTAANPYVTILGPIESAAKRMSIMGLFNKIAGMIGIFWLSKVLFSDMSSLSESLKMLTGSEREMELDLLAQRIVPPYIGIAVGLVLLAFMVLMAKLPKVENQESESENAQHRSIFSFPYLWLGVLALFLYVGVEVIAIDTLGLYAQSQGVSKEIAPMLGTFSLIALTIGYILGIILVPKYISQSKALTYCAALGFVFAILAFGAGLDSAIIDSFDSELINAMKVLATQSPKNTIEELYIKLEAIEIKISSQKIAGLLIRSPIANKIIPQKLKKPCFAFLNLTFALLNSPV
jgi:fucose permease